MILARCPWYVAGPILGLLGESHDFSALLSL